ncbi:hypothetical protein CR513_32774, partial [Mucuna pruriens]
MLIVALLSQYNFIGMCMGICNSLRTLFNQRISHLISHNSIFCFCTTSCYNILFLTSPSYQIFPNIRVSVGLQPLIPVSLRRSRIYFLYETMIPFFDLATSIPRKYLKDPRSLISNVVEMELFKRFISKISFPVRIISSTYTINMEIFLSCECLKNISIIKIVEFIHFLSTANHPPNGQLLKHTIRRIKVDLTLMIRSDFIDEEQVRSRVERKGLLNMSLSVQEPECSMPFYKPVEDISALAQIEK